jgi:hypothetical protein
LLAVFIPGLKERFSHEELLKMKVVFTGSEGITSRMTTEGINLGGQTSLLDLALPPLRKN